MWLGLRLRVEHVPSSRDVHAPKRRRTVQGLGLRALDLRFRDLGLMFRLMVLGSGLTGLWGLGSGSSGSRTCGLSLRFREPLLHGPTPNSPTLSVL